MEAIPQISVIVPTFNRANYLKNTLYSILFQNYPPDQYEIIIVDGGSSDNTKELCHSLKSQFPDREIHYFHEPEPGLLSGRHRGLQESRGEILVFIDDDIEATEGWLSAIYKTFKDPTVQIVGGKNLPKYEIEPPNWLAQLWNTTQYGGRECGYLSLLDLGDEQIDIHPIYVWGLNFSIRKDAIKTLGGFHPDTYPKYLQRYQGDGETGLSMKAFKKGYKAVYQPEAIIFHFIPADRLTNEYFENRTFFQGVCNSYSDMRRMYDVSQKASSFSLECLIDSVKRVFSGLIRKLIAKIVFQMKNPTEIMVMKKRMEKTYNNGYQFHQNEVKNDPKLLEWVLKEDYWDYHIPSYWKEDKNVDHYEKSY